jgi:hypothetical protein
MFSETRPQSRKIGVCEVCRKLDGDSSPKPVEWCPSCRADICDRCRGDWGRRLKAAAIKGMGYVRAI